MTEQQIARAVAMVAAALVNINRVGNASHIVEEARRFNRFIRDGE